MRKDTDEWHVSDGEFGAVNGRDVREDLHKFLTSVPEFVRE